MIIVKRTLVPILSLFLLTAPITISLNFCLATEPLTETDEDSFSPGENYPGHHQTTCDNCRNRSPCQYVHSCCNLAPPTTLSYLVFLNPHPLTIDKIFFKLLEIPKSFYHPPRTLL